MKHIYTLCGDYTDKREKKQEPVSISAELDKGFQQASIALILELESLPEDKLASYDTNLQQDIRMFNIEFTDEWLAVLSRDCGVAIAQSMQHFGFLPEQIGIELVPEGPLQRGENEELTEVDSGAAFKIKKSDKSYDLFICLPNFVVDSPFVTTLITNPNMQVGMRIGLQPRTD